MRNYSEGFLITVIRVGAWLAAPGLKLGKWAKNKLQLLFPNSASLKRGKPGDNA
jgi:hypothetical protein